MSKYGNEFTLKKNKKTYILIIFQCFSNFFFSLETSICTQMGKILNIFSNFSDAYHGKSSYMSETRNSRN